MIKIQADEYSHLLQKSEALHKESMELIEEYIRGLDELLIPEGGFYADMISDKVMLLKQLFQEKLVKELEVTFRETEKQIRIFGEKIAGSDESGRLRVKWEE